MCVDFSIQGHGSLYIANGSSKSLDIRKTNGNDITELVIMPAKITGVHYNKRF